MRYEVGQYQRPAQPCLGAREAEEEDLSFPGKGDCGPDVIIDHEYGSRMPTAVRAKIIEPCALTHHCEVSILFCMFIVVLLLVLVFLIGFLAGGLKQQL
jgi:hypothetical protein